MSESETPGAFSGCREFFKSLEELETGLVRVGEELWFYDKEFQFSRRVPEELLDVIGNELDIKQKCELCGKTKRTWTLKNGGSDGLSITNTLLSHCSKDDEGEPELG